MASSAISAPGYRSDHDKSTASLNNRLLKNLVSDGLVRTRKLNSQFTLSHLKIEIARFEIVTVIGCVHPASALRKKTGNDSWSHSLID